MGVGEAVDQPHPRRRQRPVQRAEHEQFQEVGGEVEAGLLQDLGFGLDLSKCAATGSLDDLIYVSPRTGRAVSRTAGEPYKDRLLALPPFMLSSQGRLSAGDVRAGLDLTAHFLELFVFGPLNRPLPPARVWLVDRLTDAQRL